MAPTAFVVNGRELSSHQLQLAKALSLYLQVADGGQAPQSGVSPSTLQQRIAIFNDIMNNATDTTSKQPRLSLDTLLPVLNICRDPRIKSALDMVRMNPKIWEALAAKEVSSWRVKQTTLVSR